jgi:hypothetical protein
MRIPDAQRWSPRHEGGQAPGDSVAMLLKRYANYIDGQQAAASERIARALGDS